MEWILILHLYWYKGAGIATATFNSQEACHYAGQTSSEQIKGIKYHLARPNVKYLCVPKGE